MENKDLFNIVNLLHKEAYKLSAIVFDKSFENAGNIGIFCQNDTEYKELINLKNKITVPDKNPNRKYFELKDLIHIDGITYKYLYIRKPDPTPYGKFRGDIDFYTDVDEFNSLKGKVKSGEIEDAEIYNQEGVGELIQFSHSKFNTVSYLSTKDITEKIRFRH